VYISGTYTPNPAQNFNQLIFNKEKKLASRWNPFLHTRGRLGSKQRTTTFKK
jgi:hypothetical protein